MSALQIATLCIRLAALAWTFYTIGHLYELFVQLESDPFSALNGSLLFWFTAFQLLVCVALWLFPATIAAKLLPSLRAAPATAESPFIQWQTVGVICVGLWALTGAIPDAIYWVTLYGMADANEIGLADLRAQDRAGMIATAAQLGIGVWLLLGAKGFAAFLFRLRSAGLREQG